MNKKRIDIIKEGLEKEIYKQINELDEDITFTDSDETLVSTEHLADILKSQKLSKTAENSITDTIQIFGQNDVSIEINDEDVIKEYDNYLYQEDEAKTKKLTLEEEIIQKSGNDKIIDLLTNVENSSEKISENEVEAKEDILKTEIKEENEIEQHQKLINEKIKQASEATQRLKLDKENEKTQKEKLIEIDEENENDNKNEKTQKEPIDVISIVLIIVLICLIALLFYLTH